eukprot:9338928-Alexandrium_andersonii.AAC.1
MPPGLESPRAPVRWPVGCGVRLGHPCNWQFDCPLGAAFALGTCATGVECGVSPVFSPVVASGAAVRG